MAKDKAENKINAALHFFLCKGYLQFTRGC